MIPKPCVTAAAAAKHQLMRLGLDFRGCYCLSSSASYPHPPISVESPFSSDSTAMLVEIVASGVGSLQDMEASLDRLGVVVTPALVSHIIVSCCKKNLLVAPPAISIKSSSSRRLLRFFSWCQRKNRSNHEEELGDDVFNQAIQAFSEMKDLTAMGIAILHLQKEGRKMDPETFVHVAETLVTSGRPDEAVCLFRRMEEKQQLLLRSPDGGGWSSVTATVHALCAKGHARKAQGILWHHKDKLQQLPSPEKEIHHLRSHLVHGWCVHGNTREARRLIDEMKSSEIGPGLASYHDLLRCICKRNLKFNPSALVPEATDLMMEMRCSGVSPTTVTFNILLSCLGKTRRVKEASIILSSMMRGEAGCCSPDSVSYYLVVRLLFLTGRLVRGKRMVDEMVEEKGLAPGAKFCHALIGVLCGVEELECALQMFDRMKRWCCGEDHGPTYHLLITKLCRNGDFEKGGQLWDEAVEKGVNFEGSRDFMFDPLRVFRPPTASTLGDSCCNCKGSGSVVVPQERKKKNRVNKVKRKKRMQR